MSEGPRWARLPSRTGTQANTLLSGRQLCSGMMDESNFSSNTSVT